VQRSANVPPVQQTPAATPAAATPDIGARLGTLQKSPSLLSEQNELEHAMTDRRLREIFAGLDRNTDGTLDRQEIRNAIKASERDCQGQLHAQDFTTAGINLMMSVEADVDDASQLDEEVERLLQQRDMDADGELSFPEFRELIREQRSRR
jgi:Ca2+-binding EF-hand superfamily protein